MRKSLSLIFLCISFASGAQVLDTWLAARMNGNKLLDNSNIVEFWGYGNYSPGIWSISLPAPLLEYQKDDSVAIHFINDSPEDHTIHLHGLDVPTDMDGVPTTSFAVDPDDTAHYEFVANHAGIFLYHCHVLTTLHLTMGMYGMIVVHDGPGQYVFQGGPSYTNDYNFLCSDMDESVNTNPLSPGPFNEFQMDYFMVNGLSGNQLYNSTPNHVFAHPGDSVLLRIGSMAYSKSTWIFPPELNAIAYTSDGRVLPSSFECDTLVVHSGERYQVLLTPYESVDTDIQVISTENKNNVDQHTNLIRLNTDLGFEEKEQFFTVYPNPATQSIFLERRSNEASTIELFTISGKQVKVISTQSKTHEIDIQNLDAGVYLVKIGEHVQKFIKQ